MRNIVDNFLSGMSHALVNIIINNILSAIIKGKKSNEKNRFYSNI